MIDKIYSIDYLKGTSDCFPIDDSGYPTHEGILFFNKLLNAIGIENKNYYDYEISHYGLNGYRKQILIEEGISLYFDSPYTINKYGNQTFCLDIKGEGCDLFTSNAAWLKLLDFLFDIKFNFTRSDAAVDDFYGYEFKRKDIHDVLINQKYIKRGTFEPKFTGKIYDPNNDKGYTVDLYSSTSDIQFRIYDKAAERKEKVGYLADTPQWIRYEMQFNHANAARFIKQYYLNLLKNDEAAIAKLISANLNALFRVCIPTNDSNKSRWPTDPRWEKFIGSIEEIEFDRKIVHRSNIDSLKEYLELNYNKGLGKIMLCKGLQYFNTWCKMVALNGIANMDDAMFHEINAVRSKSGYSKYEKTEIQNFKLENELSSIEKKLINTWGNSEEVEINDITREETLLTSLLFYLDKNKLDNGEVVIKSTDFDLIGLIKNYLSL